MRKILALLAIISCFSGLAKADVTTLRLSLTKPTTSFGDIWGQKINNDLDTIDAGIAGQSLYNIFTTTNTFLGNTLFPTLTAGSCLTVDSTGTLITQSCGGGGGSSSLATMVGSVLVSTPTAVLKFSTNTFRGSLAGAATAQVDLLPTTTYFIQNSASAQAAGFNVTTATASTLAATTASISSGTYTNATISGPTLAYSSGTFTSSVAIGTTNVNGQPLRVIDTNGSGVSSFESSTNTTLTLNLKNSTSGSSPNTALSIVGVAGDSPTGAVNGDSILRGANSLYLIGGGAASSRGVQIATNGVTHIYFSDGSTMTSAGAGGNFIENTSTLQSGSTFYVSSGTANNLTVGSGGLIVTGGAVTVSNGPQQVPSFATGVPSLAINYLGQNQSVIGTILNGGFFEGAIALAEGNCIGPNYIGFRSNNTTCADLFWGLPVVDAAGFWKSDGAKNLSIASLTSSDMSAIYAATGTWTARQSWTNAQASSFTAVFITNTYTPITVYQPVNGANTSAINFSGNGNSDTTNITKNYFGTGGAFTMTYPLILSNTVGSVATNLYIDSAGKIGVDGLEVGTTFFVNGNVTIGNPRLGSSSSSAPRDGIYVAGSGIFNSTISVVGEVASGVPTVSTGTGAGTIGSPSASIAGGNSYGVLTLNTATAPSTSATVVTITPSKVMPTKWVCSLTPANATTSLLSGATMVNVTATTSTWIINSGGTGLTGSSTYVWNYTCGGY